MNNEAIDQITDTESTGIVIEMTNPNNENIMIGDLLREAREKKSLSIDAISRHTKINCTNLEALESNDREGLPNIAYVKGFVKSYSRIVDVDTDEALALLEELYNGKPSPVEDTEETIELVTEPAVPKQSNQKVVIDNSIKFKIFGVVAACAISAFIFISRSDSEKEVQQEEIVVKTQVLTSNTPLTKMEAPKPIVLEEKKAEVAKEVETTPVVEKKVKEIIKVEEKKKEVKVKAKKEIEVASQPIEKKEEEKKVKVEKSEKEIEFYNFPFPLYTIKEITTEQRNEIVPESYRNSLQTGKQNVFITAVEGDTWLTYKSDDAPVKKFILKKGRYILIRGDEVKIFLGNVHVAKVFLNNELLSIKSRSGVKSLVFPQELAKSQKLPLFIFQKTGKVITSEEYLEEHPQD